MDTTDFEDVLRDACAEAGADGDSISLQEFMAWRRFANRRLEVAWRYHYWPDLGRIDQRFYRLPWQAEPASPYVAATAGEDNSANEVWWALTGAYYVALNAVPANTPPTDGQGNINLNFWGPTAQFDIQPDPTGSPIYGPSNPPYPVPWLNYTSYDPTVVYNQGDRVQYGGQVYQLYALTALNVLPTDATSWGLIPPFDAYVPFEQSGQVPFTVVEGVYSSNPRTTTRGNGLNYFLSERGVQVLTRINFAWVQYRLRCPKLNGNYYRADTAYQAGWTMYYQSANVPGNFYQAVEATAPGDTPESEPTEWAVVQIPRIFHRYLVLGMAADFELLQAGAAAGNQGELQESQLGQQMAQAELDDVKSLYVGQMGMRVKTVVRTR